VLAAGDVATAAAWNVMTNDVIDHELYVSPIRSAWTSFTPTLVQSVTVAKTVETARYLVTGKLAIVQVRLTVTGTGTANNEVRIGLPSVATPASRSSFWPQGVGNIYDSSAASAVMAMADCYTYGYVILFGTSSTFDNSLGNASTPFSAALAVNDRIGYSITYEIA